MTYLLIYAGGVVVALAVMRDPWRARVATALAWPLGPAAFVVVVSILLIAAVLLWPVRSLAAAALAGTLLWLAV